MFKYFSKEQRRLRAANRKAAKTIKRAQALLDHADYLMHVARALLSEAQEVNAEATDLLNSLEL